MKLESIIEYLEDALWPLGIVIKNYDGDKENPYYLRIKKLYEDAIQLDKELFDELQSKGDD